MNPHDIYNLQEAYLEVYQELDEATRMRKEFRAQTGNDSDAARKETRVRQSMAIKSGGKSSEYPGTARKDVSIRRPATRILRPGSGDLTTYNLQRARKFASKNEEVDIYDIILSHLLDEGYADCLGSAEIILENMSEDWINDIVEGFIDPEEGRAPSGRSPIENVSYHPSKKIRKKAMAALADRMGVEYGGKWKAKVKDPTEG